MSAEAPDAVTGARVDAVTALLWRRPAPARPGPKPRFSVKRVAAAGIQIADAQGLDAVTMQRVAELLGTTKMALYRYVPGRVELDAVMLDQALGDPPVGAGEAWRPALRTWADRVHARMQDHPWCVELVQRPHPPGPCELAWYESGLVAVDALPLTGAEKLDALVLLVGHVMSIVRQQPRGMTTEDDLATRLAPILASRADAYPLTVAAFAPSDASRRDDALRFGVDRVIAGIGALADERS